MQASEHNNENVMITNDAGFTAAFQQQFEALWQLFTMKHPAVSARHR